MAFLNPPTNSLMPLVSHLRIAPLLALVALMTTGVELRAAQKITYDNDVVPILRQHCVVCHQAGESKGGLALDSFASLMEGGGSGEIVFDDGDAEGSRMWQVVNHDDTPVMPPNGQKLPDEQLAVLRAWIEGGALQNDGSVAKVKTNALAGVVVTAGKPDGPAAMPQSLPQSVPVTTDRAAAITAVAASPWAPLVAVAGQRQISLYHADSADLLGVLAYPAGIAQSLRFSREGGYLIAGGGEHSVSGSVTVYDVRTGETVATVGDELDVVFDADANDNMTRIALGGPQKMLRVYDAADATLVYDLKKHTDWILAVAFSPDGVLVASADRSGGLHVWEADTGQLYLDLTGHKDAIHSLSWRDDSNVLASASADGTVKAWDLIEGTAIKTINAHKTGVTSVRFSHDGGLVTGGLDGHVRTWDGSGKQLSDVQVSPEAVLEVAVTHDAGKVVYGDWTGDAKLISVADPSLRQPVSANPPPASERAEEVSKRIEAQRSRIAEAKKATAEAQQSVDELKQQLDAAKDMLQHRQDEQSQQADALEELETKLGALQSAVSA